MLVVTRGAIVALSRVHDAAVEIAAGASGTLRLGTTEGARGQLHLILDRFRERRPDVEVRLLALRPNEKVRALLDGELDAGPPPKSRGSTFSSCGASGWLRCSRVGILWRRGSTCRSPSSPCLRSA
jgi:DNA-binding transcriptional LysR family regulator